MKKIITYTLSLLMIIVLVACGTKKEKLAFTAKLNQNGFEVKMDFYAIGDKVTKMSQDVNYDLSKFDEAQISLIKKEMKRLDDEHSKLNFTKYKHTEKDNKILEHIEMNTSKKSYLKSLSEKKLITLDSKADYISLDKTKKALQNNGFSLKENN